MNWKFWKKTATDNNGKPAAPKLSGPKDIPETIGMYMVTTLHKNPDWVWTLKAVMRDRADSKEVRDIRIYDPSKTSVQKVAVKNYTTLEAHPALILFEGWFDKKRRKFEIKEITPTSEIKAA